MHEFLYYPVPMWVLLIALAYILIRTLRRIRKTIHPVPLIMNKTPNYDALRDAMMTGDVIAFQGSDFFAKIIQKVSGNIISHVGVVIRFGGFDADHRNYILESVTDKGVCLIPLSLKLQTYRGRAWWYPLKSDVTEAQRGIIYEFMMKQLGVPYDFRNISEITKQVLKKIVRMKQGMTMEDANQMICSELCAFAFKEAGLLPKETNASSLKPVDIVQQPFLRDNQNIL